MFEKLEKDKYGNRTALRVERSKNGERVKISIGEEDDYPYVDGLVWSSIEVDREEWEEIVREVSEKND